MNVPWDIVCNFAEDQVDRYGMAYCVQNFYRFSWPFNVVVHSLRAMLDALRVKVRDSQSLAGANSRAYIHFFRAPNAYHGPMRG